jgi:hypothetical protein
MKQLRLTVWLNGCVCPPTTTGLTGDPTEDYLSLTYMKLPCLVFVFLCKLLKVVIFACGSLYNTDSWFKTNISRKLAKIPKNGVDVHIQMKAVIKISDLAMLQCKVLPTVWVAYFQKQVIDKKHIKSLCYLYTNC